MEATGCKKSKKGKKAGFNSMQDSKPDQTPNRSIEMGQVSFVVLPQENGRFACALSPGLTDKEGNECVFYGQTREHALAVAFEHLADRYRTAAEESQLAREPKEQADEKAETPIKRYHVILHYESIIEEESRFEAMHDTLLGNTVVENAKCTLIEIAPNVRQKVLCRDWGFDDELVDDSAEELEE